MGWPENTRELELFYPTSVLVTGFDILFFWVARMMMMGLKFMKDVPFYDVYIHALVRDIEGQKMSKTRGNVIDPLVVIEKFGSDAFRFSLAAFAAQGRDIRLSEERIEGYRNFANKIWNAARFVLMNVRDYEGVASQGPIDITSSPLPDRWICARLNGTIREVRGALEEYRFNDGAQVLYQFIWHELCDWYLELIKPYLYREEYGEGRALTQQILVYVMDQTLRLLHPYMPCITEEIWQQLPHEGESIMVAEYPEANGVPDERAVGQMERLMGAINGVRNIRGEMDIAPGTYVDVILVADDEEIAQGLDEYSLHIKELGRVKTVNVQVRGERPRAAAASMAEGVEVFVPLARVVENPESEKARLQKQLDKILADLERTERKLGNETFVTEAPAEVVAKEQNKRKEFKLLQEKLGRRIAVLDELRSEG